MFENPKNWEELKSNISEILKKNKAREEQKNKIKK